MSAQQKEVKKVAAVGVLIEEERFLVIKRSQSVVAPGKICFPGGTIEPGETTEDALKREFKEEVSLDVAPVKEVWNCVTPWKCLVHWWTVKCDDSTLIRINEIEVDAYFWKGVADLLGDQCLLESNRHFLEKLRCGDISL